MSATAESIPAARNARPEGRSPAQWFCLVGGAILAIRGAVGLAIDPSFEMPGEGWHQLIHMTSGLLLLAIHRDAAIATIAALAFGIAYAAIGVIGVVNGEEVVGLIPVGTSDNIIHSVITLAALGTGLTSLPLDRTTADAPA
jgi:hypothetical protein